MLRHKRSSLCVNSLFFCQTAAFLYHLHTLYVTLGYHAALRVFLRVCVCVCACLCVNRDARAGWCCADHLCAGKLQHGGKIC